MAQKVLFTSDIHGNESQYSKLISHALEISADVIIIGGDITPKNFSGDIYIKGQREFLKNRLPELLYPLKNGLPNSRLFLMMGNDDCIANSDILEKHDSNLCQAIHGKRLKLSEDFEIIGYSYVPITPFGMKDWEKYDFSLVPENLKQGYLDRKKTNCRLGGIKSIGNGWRHFLFTPETEQKDSIQRDLSKELFTKNAGKTVYVFHTPPNNTNLDITSHHAASRGQHVGSMAVRLFIETRQPYLTLHGHIHETVDISGEFKDKIGNTLCLSSGNHNIGDKLAVLAFDLHKPQEVKRVII